MWDMFHPYMAEVRSPDQQSNNLDWTEPILSAIMICVRRRHSMINERRDVSFLILFIELTIMFPCVSYGRDQIRGRQSILYRDNLEQSNNIVFYVIATNLSKLNSQIRERM